MGALPCPPDAPDCASRREAFVLSLGAALHAAGIPAHRLEAALTNVSRHLGLQGQFFSTPTSLIGAFGALGQQHTAFVRIEPGDIHLARMVALDDIGDRVIAGELDVEAARAEVERVAQATEHFGPVATTAAAALVSASAVTFFGGTWAEVGLAGGVGLCVGLLTLLAARVPAVARLYLPLTSAAAAALAAAAAWAVPGANPHILSLSGLIILVPGLTLTVAANELASGHLVSGTARLSSAGATLLLMGLGVVLGSQLAVLLPPPGPALALLPLPAGAVWPGALTAAACLLVLFQARPKDLWVVLGAAVVAMGAARLAALGLPAPAPAFLGALAVGLFANGYARLTNHPSLVASVPGILLLVPGSVGFNALSAMLEREVIAGVETAFSAALAAVALAAGLLVANAALPAHRNL
ncbi:MAG: threonine/serine exporter family protein [Pseudomonadota bacterium]